MGRVYENEFIVYGIVLKLECMRTYKNVAISHAHIFEFKKLMGSLLMRHSINIYSICAVKSSRRTPPVFYNDFKRRGNI